MALNKEKNTPLSYAQAMRTQNSKFPKRDQAIILDYVEDLRLADYVISVGSIVGPRNVVSASRIANNRICIYLSSTEVADEFVGKHPELLILAESVKVRKLITPAKRIIISNVSSSIPHLVIESALKELGLTLMSPITTLKAGIPGDEYSHIESFRRQVFVAPELQDNKELPSSLVITHDDTTYRIFLCFDEMVCFICKKSGHIAAKCTLNAQAETSQLDREKSPQQQAVTQEEMQQVDQTQSTNAGPDILELLVNKKRNFPTDSLSSEQNTLEILEPQTPDENVTEKPFKEPLLLKKEDKKVAKAKRVKRSTSLDKQHLKTKSSSTESLASTGDELYTQMEEIIEGNQDEFPLSYDNFRSFLDNAHGNSNPTAELLKFTEDIMGVINMMKELHAQLNSQSMKNRLTRLRKKLEAYLETPPNVSDS